MTFNLKTAIEIIGPATIIGWLGYIQSGLVSHEGKISEVSTKYEAVKSDVGKMIPREVVELKLELIKQKQDNTYKEVLEIKEMIKELR